jgi:hypothetical protein
MYKFDLNIGGDLRTAATVEALMTGIVANIDANVCEEIRKGNASAKKAIYCFCTKCFSSNSIAASISRMSSSFVIFRLVISRARENVLLRDEDKKLRYRRRSSLLAHELSTRLRGCSLCTQ